LNPTALSLAFINLAACDVARVLSSGGGLIRALARYHMGDLMKFGSLLLGMIVSLPVIGTANHKAIEPDICVTDTLSVASVSGKVIAKFSKGEEPFNNAVVTLIRGGNTGPVLARQTVKGDGRFSFRVKSGKYQLKVSAPGISNFYLNLQVTRAKASKDKREIVIILGPAPTSGCFGSSAELRVKID
jgi:hypothetical protein